MYCILILNRKLCSISECRSFLPAISPTLLSFISCRIAHPFQQTGNYCSRLDTVLYTHRNKVFIAKLNREEQETGNKKANIKPIELVYCENKSRRASDNVWLSYLFLPSLLFRSHQISTSQTIKMCALFFLCICIWEMQHILHSLHLHTHIIPCMNRQDKTMQKKGTVASATCHFKQFSQKNKSSTLFPLCLCLCVFYYFILRIICFIILVYSTIFPFFSRAHISFCTNKYEQRTHVAISI